MLSALMLPNSRRGGACFDTLLCHGGKASQCRLATVKENIVQAMLVPGALVRHPSEPDWGIGQVQTVVGARVTVNFEHAGKRLINSDIVNLELIASERDF